MRSSTQHEETRQSLVLEEADYSFASDEIIGEEEADDEAEEVVIITEESTTESLGNEGSVNAAEIGNNNHRATLRMSRLTNEIDDKKKYVKF